MSWSAEDEARLQELDRVAPIAALHIRESIRQAVRQRQAARLEHEAFKERLRRDSRELFHILGPDAADAAILRGLGIRP